MPSVRLPWLSLAATLAITICLLCCAAVPGSSQTTTLGTISGTITDSSNAVVPDATVTIKDTATGELRTLSSNGAGRYVFANVSPGNYDLTVVKVGFAKVSIPGQVVEIGQVSTRNITLKVGSQSETIEVADTSVELQTQNATIGNIVTGISLQSLPSISRDTSTFLTLQPGITPNGNVAGTLLDQNTFQLDGGNNTSDMDGSMSNYTPTYAGDPTGGVASQSYASGAGGPTGVMPTPIDSVEEFKVSTAGQGADFNSSSGAQVQVITKRGTSQWHGTAYEYYLDNNLNANTWQNNYTGTPNSNYHYSRFGVAIGGPIIPKKVLGGNTYVFANYQGFRWPNATTIERAVPSEAMRLGLLQFDGQVFNLNPSSVTYHGQVYMPAQCPAGPCDPRSLGINPLVQQMWNKYMPLSNESGCGLGVCDGLNVQGYLGNVAIPQNDNFGVARLDHDFGSRWHFMSSYRYYHLTRATTDQVDIGGFFPGNALGTPASLANRPEQPWFLAAALTGTLTSNITNSFVYSYLRNYWAWSSAGDPSQFSRLAGALEPFGESPTQSLLPYNVNTQQTRTRYWDGHDNMFRDDVTWLHGKHLIQFGGMYQHNWNGHRRTDNGGGINYYPVYQLGTVAGPGIDMTGYIPSVVTNTPTWGRDYAAVMGIVSISQIAYTRSGKNLTLNPPLTPATDQSTIPYYNFYGSDTWRITSRLSLTFGLGWTLEMPPTEADGKQVIFVGPDNEPISAGQYLNARKQAALEGQVYNPQVGFSLVGNLATPQKYPFNPFYGEWSPHLAASWDVFGDGRTVIRGGYGRTYGRLNGVALVLIPLLGTGLIQPVQCVGATIGGGCGGANPLNAFRIGADGLTAPLPAATPTLPQPLYPGVNGVAAGPGTVLDPNFRPNVVDSFTFTFQRQLSSKVTMEIGYIGRLINHEFLPINLDAVPYMITKGGQTFAKAYANTLIAYCGNGDPRNMGGGNCVGNSAAVTPQPFFEAALSGSGYCNGFANCTQAFVANEGLSGTGNLPIENVWSLYSDLDNGAFNFPRSMMNTPLAGQYGANGQLTSGVGIDTSMGYGSYNALFITVKTSDWKGMTMVSNFTWSKALGTGTIVQSGTGATPPDPFNLGTGYGMQAFDRTLIYNLYTVYQPRWYKAQSGFMGHLLGGWTIAPIFTAGSGLPITLGTINGDGQAFGEGDSSSFAGNFENAIPIVPITGHGSRHFVAGTGIGTAGLGGANLFADPAEVYNNIRQPILGYDSKDGGFGPLRGMPFWNVDLSVKKMFKITERLSTEFQVVFTNVFNHDQFGDPSNDYLDTSSPQSFGALPGTVKNTSPRQIEFGARLSF